MIFHADCNNFFASCECLTRPELKKVPMAVAGDPEKRAGIVVAKNEAAKKYGVKTTDTVYTARRKCPDIVFVPPRHHFYKQISDRVNAIYLEYTPLVEPASIDESYLSLETEDPVAFADRLRARIREEIGITISVGISYCKIFAKMGSDYKKPDATTLITRENYRELLWPLPVDDLLFVGKACGQTLRRKYIKTIGDLARSPREYLVSILGKQGGMLWDYANGIDPSRVRRFEERDDARSVSHGKTYPSDLKENVELHAACTELADSVSRELRRKAMKGDVIEIRVRRPDLTVMSRRRKLNFRTDLAHDIRAAAIALLEENLKHREPVRALTIGVSNLVSDDTPEQLSLFDGDREKNIKLEAAVNAIRDRFGSDTISQGFYARAKEPKS